MKRLTSIILVLILVMSMLAGCSKNTAKDTDKDSTDTASDGNVKVEEDTATDEGDAAAEEENTEPTEPRILTSLMESSDGYVRNFNPYTTSVYQFCLGFMFEPLIVFDGLNNNEEHMWLAEDVISEPDNKTLTIKVRQGIKWSDGEDFNADDVVFTYNYTKDHPEIDRSGDWGENGKYVEVTKVDDYTVKVVMKAENRFNRIDATFQKWIVPEHIFSKIDDPAAYVLENPVVTGAFSEVISFKPEMVELGRNPNYWQADQLKVDILRVPQFNGNDGALALLQSGTVDWAHIFIPNAEDTYVQGDPHRKFWYGQNDAVRLAFNYMTPNADNLKAFTNVDFKRACSMAVDRTGIIDSAVFGYLSKEVPSNTGLPPALFGYKSEAAEQEMAKYTTYDIEGAKALLTSAGFVDSDGDGFVENPDGSKIAFEILSPAGWSDWNDGAAICAQGLQQIGVNATAKAIDLSLIIESWGTGEHDVLYGGYGASPNIWKFYFDTIGDPSRVKTPTWWSTCQTNYINEDMNAMIAKMPSASDTELKELTDGVEKYFAENMINIPILYNGNWFVYNDSRFTGWATAENPVCQPANCVHDSKLLQLLKLEPVE
ncbi:MAG: hypothetical protein K0S47_2929 [Herbinix sp.]|jgi:peptide/nickel transport system substrate-binding protein|nr:hypothetical protein [Herbinix sp.]